MTTRPNTTPRVPRSSLAPLLLCALALSGCDQRGKTAQANEKNANQLQAINAGVGPLAAEKYSQKQFNTIVADLKTVSDQGSPGENAAALILTARSQLGLALQPAADASSQERDSFNRSQVIGSHLGAWIEANARAASQEQFDPSAMIAESQKEAADKATQADAITKEKAQVDRQVADFRAQAAAKTAQAKAEEDQYAALKEQATKLRPTQAEPLIKQAAAHKRASDKSRTEGQLLEARADQIAPQSAEAQLQIEQFLNQKKNLEATAAQLTERAAASKAEADAARAQAAGIAAEIDKAVNELRTRRAGPLGEAFQGASSQLQAAASTAQRAAAAGSTAAKTTVGAAQQTLGDLHWAHAHGLEAYRSLLVTLAKAQPSLPQKDKYAKEAEETAAARKEALESAKSAYEAAQAAFSSAPARGDSKDRLARLSTQLEKIVKYLSGESTDLDFTKPPPPAPDETPAAEPTATAAPSGSHPDLLATLDSLIAASQTQDFAAIRPFLHIPPDMAPILDAIGKASVSQKKLESALRAKFNAGIEDLFKQTPAGAAASQMGGGMTLGGMDPKKLKDVKAADLKPTVNGDKATVTFPGSAQPAEFVLIDGKWLLNTGLDKLPPQQLEAITKMVGPIGQALEELAADVQAGKFQTLQAAAVGFLQKLQPILGQFGGGPGGGGGGGGGG